MVAGRKALGAVFPRPASSKLRIRPAKSPIAAPPRLARCREGCPPSGGAPVCPAVGGRLGGSPTGRARGLHSRGLAAAMMLAQSPVARAAQGRRPLPRVPARVARQARDQGAPRHRRSKSPPNRVGRFVRPSAGRPLRQVGAHRGGTAARRGLPRATTGVTTNRILEVGAGSTGAARRRRPPTGWPGRAKRPPHSSGSRRSDRPRRECPSQHGEQG